MILTRSDYGFKRRGWVGHGWDRQGSSPTYLPRYRLGHVCSASHAVVPDSVLFIAPVWPEASSSAAGVRTKALCDHFLGAGWRVSFLSVADRSHHEAALAALGVATFSVKVPKAGQGNITKRKISMHHLRHM